MQDPLRHPARPIDDQIPSATPTGPISNSYWLVPGRFACGEYPGDMDGAADFRLKALVQAGLNSFIDLTQEGELTKYGTLRPYIEAAQTIAAATGVTVRHTRQAIIDHQVPATKAAMAGILDHIDRALTAGENVYLHCWGGVGRTGTVAGCWLVRRGLTGDQALEYLRTLWQQVEKSDQRPTTPGNTPQMEYVRAWQEPQHHRMTATVYEHQNPGVFTKFDAVGIDCCNQDELSGGVVHIATGGCVLAECLACGKHWNLRGVPTHETGPMPGLPRILIGPNGDT